MIHATACHAAKFTVQPFDAPDRKGAVYRIECPQEADLSFAQGAKEPAIVLNQLIEAVDRNAGTGDTTVLLDVVGARVPAYVEGAVDGLLRRRYAAGVIIQCGGGTTHDMTLSLAFSRRLRDKVKQANRHGTVWHPVLGQRVPAK